MVTLIYFLDPDGSSNYDTVALVCHECDPPKSFVRLSNLKRHMNIHGSGFQCLECAKKFDRRERLETHKLKHTRGKKPFPCKICGKSFTRKEGLIKHKWKSHDIKPAGIFCNICGANFQMKSQRMEHLTSAHVQGPFKCTYGSCEAQFKKSTSLHAHISVCGSSNPKYICAVTSCSKVFHSKSLLDQHQLKHKDPQLICYHCGRKFRWLSSYNAHLKSLKKRDTVEKRNIDCERIQMSEPDGFLSGDQENLSQTFGVTTHSGQQTGSNETFWQPPVDSDAYAPND